jgi:hypothetical protein
LETVSAIVNREFFETRRFGGLELERASRCDNQKNDNEMLQNFSTITASVCFVKLLARRTTKKAEPMSSR